MAKAEITEREHTAIIDGMEKIVESINEFKGEMRGDLKDVREDISGLKTNMQVVEKTYVTKDILVSFTVKLIAWSITTIIACFAIGFAFVSTIPK